MKGVKLGTDSHVRTIKWLPPAEKDMVKLNFDSSVSKDRAATAFAIRNYDGPRCGCGCLQS